MFVIAGREMGKTERRLMLILGLPAFATALIAAQGLGALSYVLFCAVAMVPYSFFYNAAYRAFGIAHKQGGRAPFYVGVVVTQLAVIGCLVVWRQARG